MPGSSALPGTSFWPCPVKHQERHPVTQLNSHKISNLKEEYRYRSRGRCHTARFHMEDPTSDPSEADHLVLIHASGWFALNGNSSMFNIIKTSCHSVSGVSL